jgi:hypothetical protein
MLDQQAMQRPLVPVPARKPMSPEDRSLFTHGQCAAFAVAHQAAHPQLRFGMHYEQLTEDEARRDADENGEAWDGTPGFRVQHVFTHDDLFAYDADGAHAMPFTGWDAAAFYLAFEDVETTGMFEPGYEPDADFIHSHAPTPHRITSIRPSQGRKGS